MKVKEDINLIENIEFSDITNERWSYEYIIKIAKYGIVMGYEDGSFRPQNSISREEMAVMLKRAF